jgi:hypothetical protein
MSLTSYRAAPPRGYLSKQKPAVTAGSGTVIMMLPIGFAEAARLEDLATTYSPTP